MTCAEVQRFVFEDLATIDADFLKVEVIVTPSRAIQERYFIAGKVVGFDPSKDPDLRGAAAPFSP